MRDPPSPLYGWVECFALGFSRNGLGFVLESDRDGAFFGFLSLGGAVFTCGCVTPPPFFGGVLGFLLVGGVVDSFGWRIFSYFYVFFFIFRFGDARLRAHYAGDRGFELL